MRFLSLIIKRFSDEDCTTLAASLAYYTAFALPPLLYLLLSVLTLGLSAYYDSDQAQEQARAVLESQAARLIGNPSAASEVSAILENLQHTQGKWWKVLLSFVGIALGATGVVAALQRALNQVWGVMPDPTRSSLFYIICKRAFSLGMILGLAFLLLASLIVSLVLSSLGESVASVVGASAIVAAGVNFTVQSLVVFVFFAAILKYMPDATVATRDAVVGSLITTALFLIGRALMQLYFDLVNPGAHLGAAAASFAVLLVWVYYTSMIVLFGAVVTRIYCSLYGAGVQPEPHAVHVKKLVVKPESLALKATNRRDVSRDRVEQDLPKH